SHTELLTEMRVDDSPLVETEKILIEFPSPTIYHQAGSLAFGPDGYLHVPMGEGTVDRFAQDVTSNLLGGLHRIDINTTANGKPYGIPPGNPFVDKRGRNEYYAWGFRNPWQLSFDGEDLIVADVGAYKW
ncbi:MAG: sorbosone dehydrogenase family protein, partial [Halobacteriaceae archaeon]